MAERPHVGALTHVVSYNEGMGDARAFFAKPRAVRVHRKQWMKAAEIGEARRLANLERRGKAGDSHPGFSVRKNQLQEVMGVIAEIVMLDGVRHAGLPVEGMLLHPDGTDAVQAMPDVTITDGDVRLPIEVKCHGVLDAQMREYLGVPSKRYFAVNKAAVERELKAGAEWMLPVVCAPGGLWMLLGTMMPLVEVRSWPDVDYGHSNDGYGFELTKVAPPWWGWNLPDVERAVLAPRQATVEELMPGDG